MTRAAWKGYISLGQLGIPVRLFSGARSIRPHLFQLHETDGSPVERQLRCSAEQREISPNEIIRAVEIEPGKYLTLTDQELEVAASDAPKSIAVRQFSDMTAIPPQHFDKTFYVVPARGGERGYALLREVLGRAKKIAVAHFSIYGREHLAAMGVAGDLLMLYQLRYAAEIVPRSSLKAPSLPRPTPKEIATLSAVVERFSGPLYLEDYHDEYADHLEELVERKVKGLPSGTNDRPEPHATSDDELVPVLESVLHTMHSLPSSQT